MNESRLTRVTGVCSVVGGLAWAAACLVHNSLPQGCIDEGCAARTMRGSSPLDGLLFVVAGLMLAASGLGLLLLARAGSGLGRTGIAAGAAGAAGCLLLGAALVVSTFVDNNWNGMPGLGVPGVLLLAVGLVLVAVVVLRARVLPAWCAALLLTTALPLPFANEQTSRILLAVPFGLCWMAAGVALLRSDHVHAPA
jgi:hypothetical protein